MTPPLCTFEQSKALKALGFSWKTHHEFWWVGNQKPKTSVVRPINAQSISRPTIADAIRFFRIEKRCFGATLCTATGHFAFSIWVKNHLYQSDNVYSKIYNDWDSCESALLDRLIELTAKQD